MKILTSHSLKGMLRSVQTFAIIILLTLFYSNSYSQTKNYATTATASANATSLTGCGLLGLGPCSVTTVDNPTNATTGDENTFATVKSSGGIALNILAYSGELELKFPTNVPANTTTYIRIDSDPDLLNALLGGNLGGLLANVLGNVVLGNHSFYIAAKNASGTIVTDGSSSGQFTNSNLRLVKDGLGKFYVAITPNQIYDRVIIRDNTNALLLGANNNTKVYYAFHTSGTDPCAQAFVTSFEGTGITLDALRLGNSGVINSERAIDADPNNFSQISLGVLAVGGTASQHFYFSTPSNATDDFNLRFKTSSALLNLGLLNNIRVTAYNGNTEVYTQAINQSLLSLELLGLLNNGSIVNLPFSPGVPFDRVKVTLSSLVNANLTQTIDVYGVTRSAGRPTFTSPASNAIAACYNSAVALNATTASTNELIWYDTAEGGTPLQTVAYNGTYTTPPLTANKTYYVSARTLGCTAESARVPVVITVNPQIIFNGSTLTNATPGFPYTKQLDVATGGTPGYTYALATGSLLPTGLSLSTTGVISGTPTVPNVYTFSVVATDTKGCNVTAPYSLTVTSSLVLTPGALPDGLTGTVYPTQTIPTATGGTGPYVYSATAVPPGLSFNPTTREITGTPTQPGLYTIPITVVDANGNTITSNYTVKITDPLVLPAATLADGTVGTVYTTQVIPTATGGTTPYTYSATGLPTGLTFDPTTKAINGTPTTAGNYIVPVTVTDAEGKSVTTNYSITVNSLLLLPAATLPDGTEGAVYATQILPVATGGVGPYTYVGSNIPAGLAYNPTTRAVSGTPTQAGNYIIGVTVTDSQGKQASNTYSIKVIGTLSLPSKTLPNGIVNHPYPTQILPAVTGGTAPYSYVASNLPPGLSFNPTTREITGTPTQGGTFNVSLTATDANNNKATTTYSITVTVDAPTVASATVCTGSSATLTVSNLQPGVTYNWYASTGSTPLVTGNNGTFVTPAVTSATIFYAEAVSGTATSTRTPVSVSINPPATLATVTTNSQVINAGQTTTLTATADAGNTIAWFDAATAGTQVGSGNAFTTPALTATKIYYIETTSTNGCKSASRVPVTVTVLTNGGGAACNAANSQSSGITGLCLVCGITDAGNSTDANPNNFTRITLSVGVGSIGRQQLIFPSTGVATDSIRLDLALPTGLADVGLLNNVTVTIFNGTSVVRTVQLNGALLDLKLLSGNRFTATVLAGGTYDRVQVSFGALVTALTSLDVYGATVIYPNPTFISGAQSICSGTTATLSATANGGTTLAWFTAPTGGTQVGTGANFTTPALSSTTTYYVQVSKGSCSNVTRVPVTVTVNPAIIFAGTTLTNATIASPYSKQLPLATGGTPGFIYTLATGSNLPAGLTLSPSGLVSGTPTAIGNPTFEVTATDTKGCSTNATFNLTVTSVLALAPGALPNGITGTPYSTNGIPTATGGTGPYTYSATSLPPGLTFDPSTRIIAGTPTQIGNFTIPVTVTDANGNVITANYTLKVIDPLVLPAATLANGTTGTTYTPQTIPSATGGTGPYTYASTTGLPPGLTFDPATRAITGIPTQSGTFSVPVTVTDADGRTATNNYSIIVIDPFSLPGAILPDGTEGTVYTTQTLPSALGGVGPYTYVASNLPAGLSYNQSTREVSGTPTQAGNYSIGVTATDSEGRKASNTYALKIIGVLSLPGATLPNGIVGSPYAPQTLPAVVGGTAPYTYLATNLPPGLNFNTATREITGTPTLGGTFTISLTATDANGNKATTAYSLTVTVGDPIVASATVCAGSSATLSVSNLLSGVTYNWYASTGSTPLVTGNNGTFITPAVSSSTVFYVEAISGTAVSSRVAVTVSINPSATLATVTTNSQVINAGQSTTLLATADAGNTIQWYDANTGGNQVGSGNSFTTPVLSATTIYYVETTNANGCKSVTRVPVTVTVIINGGGADCNAANSQNSGITGLCVLCGITDAGNSTDANPNNFTRISLSVGVGASGYQQLIFPTVGTATDSLRLDLALPGGLLDLTALGNVTLNVMNGSTVVRTVQLNSSLLNLQLLSGSRFAATILAGGAYDRVRVSFGALVTAVTSLDIYGATVIYPRPTITAGAQTICAGSTATLTATANGGTTLAWYDAATGGTQLATGETFTTPVLSTSTTYYIQISKGTCANLTRVPVTITVTPALPTPVLATIANVCEGSSATLSVANPDAAVTYKWYDAATSGTLLFTGPVFSTPILTTATTYYVEASQGNCTSAVRAAAAVSVNPRPVLPVVTASSSTVSAGQTAILTASSLDATNTFNWYTSNTSTTPVYVGSTYVTPPLLITTTYFVASVSTNGCTSASRVQVTITVDGNTPNPVPCEAATTQVNGVTGVALLSGVFNPALAIDNDTQTASSLVMPVGALAASVYQRVGFGSLSQIGDTVRVLVSSPGKLLSLSLLGNAAITTYVGTNSNGDSRLLNSGLLNIQLLSGNTQALITFVPTNVFDGVEVRLNSGILGALTSINLNYAQRILVAPTVKSANVTACVGQTTQIEVSNPSASLTYKWYDATGTYLTGKDGIIFTTPILTGDTKFYVAAVSASGCVSYKTLVTVTTNPAPVTPDLLSASVNTCPNTSVTFQVKNPIAGTTYNWYSSAISTTVLFTGDTFVTPLVTANTSYFVSAVNSCGTSSTRTEGKITLGTIDVPVITPPSITISRGSVAELKATSSTTGATINWYTTANGIVPVFTGETFVTPPLNATTTYYVEATILGGCTATSRATVTVTVVPPGTPETTPCGAATTTVASGFTGLGLLGGVYNPTFAVDNDINTGSSLVIPVGLLGASAYHQVGFTGLSNVGDALTIKISNPGALLSLAVLPNLTVTTFQGTTSNNDAVSISNPLISLKLLAGGTSAILTFVPTSRFDGVELRLSSGILGALTSVNLDYAQRVIAKPILTAVTASACQGASATLSVQNPQANIIYKWYLGTTYQTGKDGATFLTDPALSAGAYTYSVRATANGCETLGTEVVVTILAPPAAPIPSTTNPATTCIGSPATLSVQAVAGVVYNWYDAAIGGNMLVTNNSSFTTPTSLSAGTYSYYVEAVSGTGCSNSTRAVVSIIVNPFADPTDLTVTGTTSLCASGTTILTATSSTVTNPVFTWYTNAALTQVAFVGAVFNTPAIAVTTKYFVTVSGTNKCANTPGNAKEVTVTVNPIAVPTDINLAGTSTVCGGSSVTLTATSTTVTNPIFTWYSDAALTTIAFTGTSFTTPVLTATTTYYVTVKGDNKCENTAATAKSITITVNPLATDLDITTSGITSICKGSTTDLSASTTTVINPIFTWYSNANLTTVAHIGASFTTPTLTSNTTYYVTVKGDNKCENLPANAKVVTVTVKEIAVAADITVSNAQICSGSTVMLMASSTTVTQPLFTWYSDASLTSVVFTGPTFTVTGLTTTTTFYVSVKGANKCENTAADAKAVTITVNPLAISTDIILNGSTVVCAGSSAVLSATSPTVTNPIFTWYSDAALTNVSFIGATYTTPPLTTNTTFYVTVKGDNKCENAPGTARIITITVSPVSTAADIAAADATICSGSGTTLVASTTTVTNPTFTWYNNAALTSVAYVGTSFVTPILNATTKYYVTVKGDNKCENSSITVKIVTVNVNPAALASDITLSTPVIVCGSGTAVINASSTTVTSPIFTWYRDASLTSVAFTGPIFTTPVLTTTTTYYVTVKGANKCENTAANAAVVTIKVNPIAVASDIVVNGSTNICGGSAAVLTASSTTVTNPVFTWYSNAALSNVAFVGAVFTTPILATSTTYYVTVKGDNKCENSAATAKVINIVVNPIASPSDVTAADATICSGSSASLVASSTTVTNPVFTWYSDAALTTPVFTGVTFNTPALTALTRYYLTVKGDNRCESSAANAKVVTVIVNAVAVALDITIPAPAKICGSGTAVLSASSTTVTNPIFTWYTDASLTSIAFMGPTFTTPVLTATTTYYVTVKGTNKCENTASGAKIVTVTVNPIAVATDITVTGSTSICASAAATLTATSTTVTNPIFTWYSDASLNTVVFTGSSFTTPILTASTTYYVTVKGDNKCENNASTARAVAITVNALPNNPVVSVPNGGICAGDGATLTITNAQAGVTYEWYNAATGGNLLFTGTTFTVATLATTTDYYILAIGTAGCSSNSGRVKATVTVNAKPTVPTVASTSVSVCTGSSAILTVTNPQIGVVYNWYTAATGGTPVGTGTTFTTPVANTNTTYYVGGANGSCTSVSRTPVNVIALPVPVAPASVTAANGTICAGSSTILTVNNPVTGLIYRWYAASSSGPVLAEGITFTTPNLTATTVYYVEAIALGGCASPTRTGVTVNVLPILEKPSVVVQTTTPTSVTFAWAAIAGATAYEVSQDNGLTWVSPTTGSTGTTYLVAGMKPDQSVSILVRAKGQIDCQTSANGSATGKATNPLGNAVYIPNTFTPNNDGKNDIFLIYGNTIASAKMSVFTQWGQLIFQSDNFANGWDGTFKGVNQPIGVYVYMVEITFNDGSDSRRKGTITLIR